MSDFTDADLRGARFVRTDLSGAVLRGVMVDDVDIDAPWLLGGDGVLRVNGVDVTGYVDAELNRSFPGRELRRPDDLEGLRTAWAAVEAAWAKATARAATMAPGVVDEQVDGEWSFAQIAWAIWSWPPTRGCAARCWASSAPTIRSDNPTWSTTPTATTRPCSPPGRRLRRGARHPG